MEVLEKPGKLDVTDRLTIRAHSYYSFRILQPITGLEEIAAWCGFHHEQLDGGGYPYGIDHADIPLEARIVAVADVFSALTEDRPYRAGLSQAAVTELLSEMVATGRLDAKVVACLCGDYDGINAVRRAAQEQAEAGYDEFTRNLRALDLSWAKESHLSWTQRLKEAVHGGATTPSQSLLSPERCALGQWVAGEGFAHYGHLPQFRELERPHRELHRNAEQIVRHLASGQRDEAARCSERIDALSGELVQLLDRIGTASGQMPAQRG